MSQVNRAERLLNKWANDPRIELTKTGKDWLVAALDPFHDTQLKDLQGWPDVETAASVVRCVKQTINISAVSGGGAATAVPWDCHIALLPWMEPQAFDVTTDRKNNVFKFNSNSTPSAAYGGLVCMKSGNGVDVNWFPSSSVAGDLLGQIVLDETYMRGIGRIVGIGYEVTDTTADIYKQGSILCYKQPQGPRDPVNFVGFDDYATAFSLTAFTGTPLRMPPKNTAQAMLFPGSRQWAAREGLYQVGTFHTNENTPFSVDYNYPVLFDVDKDDYAGSGVVNTENFHFPSAGVNVQKVWGGVTNTLVTSSPQHLHPIHQSGCIISGANPNSTFQITMNVYYESFPSITEKDILVLGTPSCEFDPVALAIYSHAISVMPVGVKLDENATGDWFFEVVKKAGDFISPILSMIPHPAAQIGSVVAKTAAKSAGSMLQPPGGNAAPVKKKKKTKAKNTALAAGSRGKKGNIQGPMRG